jgi:hypothetical protein
MPDDPLPKDPYRHSKTAEPAPGDELAAWPRKQLLAMDQRFVERVERAIARGAESRTAAAGRRSNV